MNPDEPLQEADPNTSSVRELMDHIAELNECSRRAREAGESEVGIFWLIDGALLYANTPISLATQSDSKVIHIISHERI